MQVHMRKIFHVYGVDDLDELVSKADQSAFAPSGFVRRGELTPTEGEIVCEVLFTFGRLDYKGKPMVNSPLIRPYLLGG